MTELTGSAQRAARVPRLAPARRALSVPRLTVADAAALIGVALAYAAVARVSLVFVAERKWLEGETPFLANVRREAVAA